MLTIERLPRLTLRFARRIFRKSPDAFLRKISGVIHVGANTGQERIEYAQHGLNVIWIEPIPEVFEELQKNLEAFPLQRAYRYLITDRDGQDYTFNIANNNGESSSILDLNLHREIWPEVKYDRTITLKSVTLREFLRKESVDVHKYDALVLDTQGSELLVLQGAAPLLRQFTYITTEAADFEAYTGCCQVHQLEEFLRQYGFRESARTPFASRQSGGVYFDITYYRVK
jgi:FkbM family methyltransferase